MVLFSSQEYIDAVERAHTEFLRDKKFELKTKNFTTQKTLEIQLHLNKSENFLNNVKQTFKATNTTEAAYLNTITANVYAAAFQKMFTDLLSTSIKDNFTDYYFPSHIVNELFYLQLANINTSTEDKPNLDTLKKKCLEGFKKYFSRIKIKDINSILKNDDFNFFFTKEEAICILFNDIFYDIFSKDIDTITALHERILRFSYFTDPFYSIIFERIILLKKLINFEFPKIELDKNNSTPSIIWAIHWNLSRYSKKPSKFLSQCYSKIKAEHFIETFDIHLNYIHLNYLLLKNLKINDKFESYIKKSSYYYPYWSELIIKFSHNIPSDLDFYVDLIVKLFRITTVTDEYLKCTKDAILLQIGKKTRTEQEWEGYWKENPISLKLEKNSHHPGEEYLFKQQQNSLIIEIAKKTRSSQEWEEYWKKKSIPVAADEFVHFYERLFSKYDSEFKNSTFYKSFLLLVPYMCKFCTNKNGEFDLEIFMKNLSNIANCPPESEYAMITIHGIFQGLAEKQYLALKDSFNHRFYKLDYQEVEQTEWDDSITARSRSNRHSSKS